jgi:sugar/nucleoside kinase (ribokinase family)
VALWLLGQARARGLAVTIDPGSAAFLARMGPTAFLRWTDGAAVCFPNRDEAAVLTGEAEPVAMAARLTRYYSVVLVKLGGAGCMLAVPGEAPVLIAAHPARATDTTGAGDAFCGAFMSRWLAAPAADPATADPTTADPTAADLTAAGRTAAGLTVADLTAAAEFAVQVAATVVTRFGGRPV